MSEIVLDLPAPLSVNRTRKVDRAALGLVASWMRTADALVMSKGRLPKRISGPYEAILILPEDSRVDADNTPKGVIDYARRLELVDNDDPKRLRKLTVEFGDVPEGCRLILRGVAT